MAALANKIGDHPVLPALRFRDAVNDRIGLEPDPQGISLDSAPLADIWGLIQPSIGALAFVYRLLKGPNKDLAPSALGAQSLSDLPRCVVRLQEPHTQPEQKPEMKVPALRLSFTFAHPK